MEDCVKKNYIKKIKELEKGKLYWIQIKKEMRVTQKVVAVLQRLCVERGLDVIILQEGIDFIDAPLGYEVKRKEEIVK